MKFITNIQIARRLLLAFLLAALVPGIIITILGLAFINAQRERSQAVLTNIRAFKTANEQGAAIVRMQQLLDAAYQAHLIPNARNQDSLLANTPASLDALEKLRERFDIDLRQYQRDYQISTSPQMRGTYDILLHDEKIALANQQRTEINQILLQDWPTYREAQEQVRQALTQNQPNDQIAQRLQEARNKHQTLYQNWQKIINTTEQTSNTVSQIGPSQTGPMLLATIVAFLCTIIIVTAIGYIVYLTITRPLHQLALLTKRIAKGDTRARASIRGHDEISLVAASMNTMLDNIVRLIQETERQRDTLQDQVEQLVSEVSGVGEGDLRVRAEVSANALGVLADSFNYMIEELGSLVIRVKAVAHEVERTTSAVKQRMGQLVETGQGQLQEMAQATHEVETMTTANHEVAERSQELYNVARIARQDAQAGREAVRQAIEGIGHIHNNVQATASKVQTLGERSRQINEIVEAISGIAHQTNRLALDAAIQAAMAGENGKGFGAVAADIRRLAERSKSQASIVSQIVRNVREEISAVAISMEETEFETSTGSRLTREASIALESIFSAVEHQAREIENIYQMATRQHQSSHAITQIVQRVSETTRQSSTSTQEASQLMERLAQLVEQLRSSVEVFKLRDIQRTNIPTTTTLDDDIENPLTVSGIFRTVKTVSQPLRSPVPFLNNQEPFDTRTPLPQATGQLLSVPYAEDTIIQAPFPGSQPGHFRVHQEEFSLKQFPVQLPAPQFKDKRTEEKR